MNKIFFVFLMPFFLVFLGCGSGNSTEDGGGDSSAGLKDLAQERGIRIGSNYDYELHSDAHDTLFEQEFNAMTVYMGYEGGVDHTSRNSYDFTYTDEMVDFGTTREMEIFGQSLVWFEDIPDWVDDTSLSEIETVMNEHIDAVMGRYAGRVTLWNVVNEAIDDEGNIRENNKWYEAMGSDYIAKAFVRANAADPAAILYYNEFDIESNEAKFNRVKNLLQDLLDEGVPVHALGWQMHLTPGSFDPEILLERMNEIAGMGLDNYITELDVQLPEEATSDDYEQQKQTFKSAIEVFLEAEQHQTLIFWGLRDGSPYWLTDAHPLLFDENLEEKPAYDGVREALEGDD